MTAITNLPAAIAELREIVGRMKPGLWESGNYDTGDGLDLQIRARGYRVAARMDCNGNPVNQAHAAGIVALRNTALPIIEAQAAEIEALKAERDRLREALMRLGKVGGSVVATFKPREVKLPDGEIGVAQGYGTVGKEIGQELMAALNEARAALGDQP